MTGLRLDTQAFLRDYWQQQHLFIPKAIEAFTPPADADELAGLAMESDADSRIVFHGANGWDQTLGPFKESDFLRDGSWTLLVQKVDAFWDEAAELRRLCDWIPSWRFDDVLMSYATDGGSAAPHFDRYDVFIVQGEGQRRWQIGGFCNDDTSVTTRSGVLALDEFAPENEYLLSTGDVLYIPPGCSHYGVSIGESTSFSLGFRAPRISDLLAHWTDRRLEALPDSALLTDVGRESSEHPGEISQADLRLATEQLRALFQSDDPRWLGEAATQLAEGVDLSPASSLSRNDTLFTMEPLARIAWTEHNDQMLVFANGDSLEVPQTLKERCISLCAGELQEVAVWMKVDTRWARATIDWLHDRGGLCFEE